MTVIEDWQRLREAVRDLGFVLFPREFRMVWGYRLRTWRCRLFGHKWGEEECEYEENTHVKMQCWHDCVRRGCEGWQETYHYQGTKDDIYG